MKQLVKHLLVGLLGLVALAYLLNPTAGIFECLPDNIPILGNLDEAAATTTSCWAALVTLALT